MTHKWPFPLVALCVLSLGCGKKPEVPANTGVAPAQKPVAEVPAVAAPVEAPKGIVISKFRLGTSAGADGVVAAEAHVFGPGESVFASFEVPNAAGGSRVRASWAILPDRKVVARQEATLSPDKPAVSFKGDSKGWAPGDYEFLIALAEPGKDDRTLGSATFKIVRDKTK